MKSIITVMTINHIRYGRNATASVPAKPLRPSGIKIAKPIQQRLAKKAENIEPIATILSFIIKTPHFSSINVSIIGHSCNFFSFGQRFFKSCSIRSIRFKSLICF